MPGQLENNQALAVSLDVAALDCIPRASSDKRPRPPEMANMLLASSHALRQGQPDATMCQSSKSCKGMLSMHERLHQ